MFHPWILNTTAEEFDGHKNLFDFRENSDLSTSLLKKTGVVLGLERGPERRVDRRLILLHA